jgi:hypothetical protein
VKGEHDKRNFYRSKNLTIVICLEYTVAQLVEALCYKPEGRGLDSR